MAAGLRVWNDWGTVQIDDTSPSMIVASKQTIPLNSFGLAEINVENYQYGIPAIRCDTGSFQVESILNISGQPRRLRIESSDTSGTGELIVYRFGLPTASSDGYGLRVRDASGNVTFDSSHQYARVPGVMSGTGSHSFTKQSGREYAVMLTRYWWGREYVDTGETDGQERVWDIYYRRTWANTSGANDVTLQSGEYFWSSSSFPESSPPQDFENRPESQVLGLVIDVTGY